VYRPLQLHERNYHCIGAHDEMLSVAIHVYEVRPRKDKHGVDLISRVLRFGRLCYGEPNLIENAIGYAQFLPPRAERAVIRVYERLAI
jgi:hypothetical protein